MEIKLITQSYTRSVENREPTAELSHWVSSSGETLKQLFQEFFTEFLLSTLELRSFRLLATTDADVPLLAIGGRVTNGT